MLNKTVWERLRSGYERVLPAARIRSAAAPKRTLLASNSTGRQPSILRSGWQNAGLVPLADVTPGTSTSWHSQQEPGPVARTGYRWWLLPGALTSEGKRLF